jgi:paraquat-inducible protein A
VLYRNRRDSLGRTPWGLAGLYRFLEWLQPWAMLEVYLLGVLVAIVKLGQLASIEASVGLWAFGALILVWSAVGSSLDPRVVCDAVETRR